MLSYKRLIHGPMKRYLYITKNALEGLRVRVSFMHDDVSKWKHFPHYWPFVRGIHRAPANSPHKGQWRGALMFSLICFWINGWVNNREAGDLRRYRAHYDVIVMATIHGSELDFPHKRPVRGNVNMYFCVSLHKLRNNYSSGWWFDMP